MISLKEQDKDDDDGLEQYVRHSIDAEDVEWFPKAKAMCLKIEGAKTEAERMDDMVESMGRKVEESEKALSHAHEKRTEKLQRTLEHLARQQRVTQQRMEAMAEMFRSHSLMVGKHFQQNDQLQQQQLHFQQQQQQQLHQQHNHLLHPLHHHPNHIQGGVPASPGGASSSQPPLMAQSVPNSTRTQQQRNVFFGPDTTTGVNEDHHHSLLGVVPNVLPSSSSFRPVNNNNPNQSMEQQQQQQHAGEGGRPLAAGVGGGAWGGAAAAEAGIGIDNSAGGLISGASVKKNVAASLSASTSEQLPPFVFKATVEVVDGVGMPALPGAMGSLTARLLLGGQVKGETETMWMGPKPTWFVGNKIVVDSSSSSSNQGEGEGGFTIELMKKEGRAKKGSQQAGNGPKKQLVATLQVPWSEVASLKESGEKKYFPVVPSEEYRASAKPECTLGLKFS
jgi:hypothetical protein